MAGRREHLTPSVNSGVNSIACEAMETEVSVENDKGLKKYRRISNVDLLFVPAVWLFVTLLFGFGTDFRPLEMAKELADWGWLANLLSKSVIVPTLQVVAWVWFVLVPVMAGAVYARRNVIGYYFDWWRPTAHVIDWCVQPGDVPWTARLAYSWPVVRLHTGWIGQSRVLTEDMGVKIKARDVDSVWAKLPDGCELILPPADLIILLQVMKAEGVRTFAEVVAFASLHQNLEAEKKRLEEALTHTQPFFTLALSGLVASRKLADKIPNKRRGPQVTGVHKYLTELLQRMWRQSTRDAPNSPVEESLGTMLTEAGLLPSEPGWRELTKEIVKADIDKKATVSG